MKMYLVLAVFQSFDVPLSLYPDIEAARVHAQKVHGMGKEELQRFLDHHLGGILPVPAAEDYEGVRLLIFEDGTPVDAEEVAPNV